MRNFVRLQPSGICRWVTRRVTLRPPWASACIMSVPETTTAVCDTYGSALSSALMAVTITFAHIRALPLPRRTSMLVQVNPTRPKIQEYSLWSQMLIVDRTLFNLQTMIVVWLAALMVVLFCHNPNLFKLIQMNRAEHSLLPFNSKLFSSFFVRCWRCCCLPNAC